MAATLRVAIKQVVRVVIAPQRVHLDPLRRDSYAPDLFNRNADATGELNML